MNRPLRDTPRDAGRLRDVHRIDLYDDFSGGFGFSDGAARHETFCAAK